MLVKINDNEEWDNDNNQENDLYRKFRTIFMKILHPDDNTYNPEVYIKTQNGAEDIIKKILSSSSDSIIEILGYTGMGKTFLMHYCIKTLYNCEELLKNRVFLSDADGKKALFIYASYDASRVDGAADGRLAAKLASANTLLIKQMNICNNKEYSIPVQVAKYIRDNKPELLEQYNKSPNSTESEKVEFLFANDRLAYEAEQLKWILTCHKTNVQSINIVLDDVEGLLGDEEYKIIDKYLKIYDCLRRYERNKEKFDVKLFICMRERTYNEIQKMSWYDTHRITEQPLILHSGINLHKVFMKRFEQIAEEEKILDDVTKKEVWLEAKDILMDLSIHLDRILSDTLLKICNYNVCKSLQLFARILCNRQWTQKNERMQESFKLEKYQFYLSIASAYKAIAMNNSVIYRNKYEISNLIYENDSHGYCLSLLTLLMLKSKPNQNKELMMSKIQNNFIEVMCLKNEDAEKMKIRINEIVEYYLEKELIFQKIAKTQTGNVIKYYLSPKGQVLIHQFFENTILLEMYRDDLYLDDAKHMIKGSTTISREELFYDITLIIKEFEEDEARYWESSVANHTEDIYYKLWGKERIFFKLIAALKNSLLNYYKYKREIPPNLRKQIRELENDNKFN